MLTPEAPHASLRTVAPPRRFQPSVVRLTRPVLPTVSAIEGHEEQLRLRLEAIELQEHTSLLIAMLNDCAAADPTVIEGEDAGRATLMRSESRERLLLSQQCDVERDGASRRAVGRVGHIGARLEHQWMLGRDEIAAEAALAGEGLRRWHTLYCPRNTFAGSSMASARQSPPRVRNNETEARPPRRPPSTSTPRDVRSGRESWQQHKEKALRERQLIDGMRAVELAEESARVDAEGVEASEWLNAERAQVRSLFQAKRDEANRKIQQEKDYEARAALFASRSSALCGMVQPCGRGFHARLDLGGMMRAAHVAAAVVAASQLETAAEIVSAALVDGQNRHSEAEKQQQQPTVTPTDNATMEPTVADANNREAITAHDCLTLLREAGLILPRQTPAIWTLCGETLPLSPPVLPLAAEVPETSVLADCNAKISPHFQPPLKSRYAALDAVARCCQPPHGAWRLSYGLLCAFHAAHQTDPRNVPFMERMMTYNQVRFRVPTPLVTKQRIKVSYPGLTALFDASEGMETMESLSLQYLRHAAFCVDHGVGHRPGSPFNEEEEAPIVHRSDEPLSGNEPRWHPYFGLAELFEEERVALMRHEWIDRCDLAKHAANALDDIEFLERDARVILLC